MAAAPRRKEITFKVRMDAGTYALLEELTNLMRRPSKSETIRELVVFFHVLIKSGAHKILRPIPELAQIVLEETSPRQRASSETQDRTSPQ